MSDKPVSDVRAQLLKRPRKQQTFDVGPYMSLGHEVCKVDVRIPLKYEQDNALEGAHKYIAVRSARTPAVANDPEILQDAKAAAVIAECCRELGTGFPIWPTVEEVIKELTPDEIGVLLRLVNEVRATLGPTPEIISDEQVELYAQMCADSADTDRPDHVLTPLRHTYVVQMAILFACKLKEARTALAELTKETHA